MQTYRFELVARFGGGVEEISEALFEACDDVLPEFERDMLTLVFGREAESFQDAVLSAIRQVESVEGVGRVERVQLGDLDPTGEHAEDAATLNGVLDLRRRTSRSELERLLDALQPS